MMQVVASSPDPVRISFLQALLRDAGIDSVVLDGQISGVQGGIGIFPQRVAVATPSAARARAVLDEAGLGELEA